MRVVYTQCEGLLEQAQGLYRGIYRKDTYFSARSSDVNFIILYYRIWFDDDDQNLWCVSTFLANLTEDIQFSIIYSPLVCRHFSFSLAVIGINQSISHFSIIFYMDMIAIVSIAINLVSILFIEYCYIWFSWWLVIVALYRNVTEIMLYGCGKDIPSMSLLAKNANTIKLMLQLICSKYFKRWTFLRAIDYSLRFSCPKTDVSSWTYLNFPFIFYFYFFFWRGGSCRGSNFLFIGLNKILKT